MKKIIIAVAVFIGLSSTVYAGYDLITYKETTNTAILTSKVLDDNNFKVIRFQDEVSKDVKNKETNTCYVIFTTKQQPIPQSPNISCK